MKNTECLLGRQSAVMKCDGRCSTCGFDQNVAELRRWMIRKNGLRRHGGIYRLILPPQRDREFPQLETWKKGKEHEKGEDTG